MPCNASPSSTPREHGQGRRIAGWLPLLSERYQLIRFDGRNNGLSERGVQDVSLVRLVEDVKAVMDAAGIERLPLFGISFGATIAAAFAAKFPERVSGLVLMVSVVRGFGPVGGLS